MTRRPVWIAALAVWVLSGCSPEPRQPESGSASIIQEGLRTPESVLHDGAADVYLVSNINGQPLDQDDNGFISRLAPDGRIRELRWIDGASREVTLHAPKGLALRGDTLFVADIDVIRLFHRVTGAPVGEWRVPGATFLNDVTVGDDGTVYATDSGLRVGTAGMEPSGADAVYRFDVAGVPTPLASGQALGRPNGILADGQRLIVVTFGTGQVMALDRQSGAASALPAPERGGLDGIVAVGDGSYLISSWEGEAVYRLGASGQYTTALSGITTPADIGWDATRRRLLIPLFTSDRVEIRSIP